MNVYERNDKNIFMQWKVGFSNEYTVYFTIARMKTFISFI
jgi:hypothetical protein